VFTILDLAVIERTRLRGFIAGQATRSSDAPEVWNHWVQTGEYRALTSEPTTVIRTVAEQMPDICRSCREAMHQRRFVQQKPRSALLRILRWLLG
jgi:hypothetical protein